MNFILLVLASLLAALSYPGTAAAAEALYLGWNDCRSGSGSANFSFACDANDQSYDLVVAFQPPHDITDVVGIIALVDVQHSAPALPDWWRMEPGGCRFGELLANADFTAIGDCADPWQGIAGAQIQGYDPGQPRGASSQARIKAVAGVLPSQAITLSADIVYYGVRIRFRTGETSGGGSCAGCLGSACLVLNGVLIQRAKGAEVVITTPASDNRNWATWRGGAGADCMAVPVRAATWGRVKSLYR